MPLLNFQKQFAELVATGAKRQTCRATRKYPIKAGDTLYLYTGCRTKDAHRLLPPQRCHTAAKLRIQLHTTTPRLDRLVINGRLLAGGLSRNQFARDDGFADWLEMRTWIAKTHGTATAFVGQLIQW